MRALFCRGLTLEVSLLRAEEIKPKVLSERLRKVTALGTGFSEILAQLRDLNAAIEKETPPPAST